MPGGRYLHLDPHDGTLVAVEDFSCASGPVGWRYAGVLRDQPDGPDLGRVDVTLDTGGRQVRVELAGGGWLLRGGVAGRETVWLRAAADGSSAVEYAERAAGLTGRSPAFLVAAARLLRLSAGAHARLRLVEATEPALGTRPVDQRWQLVGVATHPTETEPLPVARYQVADLGTGVVRDVHLAGDVVVSAPSLELVALHSPPTL